MKDDTYYLHQTPKNICELLMDMVPLENGDAVHEPFKGEGAFYDHFPDNVVKSYCEIEEGIDYRSHTGNIDWVISNPPFQLENAKGKRENSFYPLLDYYSAIVKKGIAFLANDRCFSTLTPKRMKKLNDAGLYLQGYTICNIKKWRGRYFFMIFTRDNNPNINFIEGSY